MVTMSGAAVTMGTTAHVQFTPDMVLDISCNDAASVRIMGEVLVAGFEPTVSPM